MLEHGGRLRAAAQHWGIPLTDWLDLSTGIAPWSYPVQINADAWQRLPEDEDGLVAAAAGYYGHPEPLPLSGSQAAIQWLPRLIAPGRALRVALPTPTYGEYAPAWHAAGHHVTELPLSTIASNAVDTDVIMLASPNNPTGERLDADTLLALAAVQERRNGWLIIDAAFSDDLPQRNLDTAAGSAWPRLIVLHSLGKFFGLAGARVGFCCAAPELRQRLADALGPWAVAHPSRQAAIQALTDTTWQVAQRLRLTDTGMRLAALLAHHDLPASIGGALFCYVPTPHAITLHEFLARRGILVRKFCQPDALRFGLPGDNAGWQRLEIALADWKSK